MALAMAFLVGLLMIGVVVVLFAGLIGVARGGGDPERSNRLMRWRVILQAAAIALFLLLLWILKS
ncbi:MAG: twin transmembrane helix small protein [Rhodospirillales bacterium]|nr:twin transmembrane helix small protein [Rhodospirillales bacterium]